MLKRHEEKAQAVLFDLLIAVVLFMIIGTATFMIFDNQTKALQEQQYILSQQKAADNALNELVSGTGLATAGGTGWEKENNIDNVKFIGLALTDRIILPEKINKFKQFAISDYEKTKDKLLTSDEYYFRLIEPGTGFAETTMDGCPDDTGTCEMGKTEIVLLGEGKKIDFITKTRRIIAFKGESAIAEIIIFKIR